MSSAKNVYNDFMLAKTLQYLESSLKNFLAAYKNFLIFLPYFFSVPTLFSTLFAPWKNLISKKTRVGFDFYDVAQRISFNLISRSLGFWMRSSLIIFYFIFQLALILLFPILFIFFLFILPIFYLISLSQKSDDQKKDEMRVAFIGAHLLRQENYQKVAVWFEEFYLNYEKNLRFWSLNNLFSIPPLARDWSMGYTPTLDAYCEDLTSTVHQKIVKNAHDRQSEINQIETALIKSQGHNVFIVGEVGIGKHTILDALAKKIYEGRTSSHLIYKRILKLNMEKILTQFIDQKQREFFFETLLDEAEVAKNVILFIDDIDKYLSDGVGRIDLTSSLDKFAQSAQLNLIGITTPFPYEKFTVRNEKIHKYFTKIDVFEISPELALNILKDVALLFEERYQVSIPYEVLLSTIDKSNFFVTSIPFPEKALELLDSICSYASHNLKTNSKKLVLTPDLVDLVLSQQIHIPTTLTEELKEKVNNLETNLLAKILGQDEAVAEISSVIRRSFVLLGKRKKPLASFLLLGPTGVGKTESAKAISAIFFGSDSSLLRFDMSEYQSKDDIAKLIGSIELGNPGLMSAKIRENPYGVLLLDEIEKASSDLLNIFLTILDEGYFTDGFGKRVDSKNLMIVATSNAGSDLIFQGNLPYKNFIEYLIEKRIFTPEFLNRFDGIIVYRYFDKNSILQIARKIVDKIIVDLSALHNLKLNVSDETLKQLIEKSYEPKFGARNMERIIRDEIEDKVAKLILQTKIEKASRLSL